MIFNSFTLKRTEYTSRVLLYHSQYSPYTLHGRVLFMNVYTFVQRRSISVCHFVPELYLVHVAYISLCLHVALRACLPKSPSDSHQLHCNCRSQFLLVLLLRYHFIQCMHSMYTYMEYFCMKIVFSVHFCCSCIHTCRNSVCVDVRVYHPHPLAKSSIARLQNIVTYSNTCTVYTRKN